MKNWLLACLLLSCLLWPLGKAGAADSRLVTDLAGRQVSLPQTIQRLVCLGPGCLRLLVYLQAQDRLAGIEEMEPRFPQGRPYYMAHPELGRLPAITPGGVGGINNLPDLERVLVVRPQVIFATYMGAAKANQLTARLGIPVVVLSYGPLGSYDHDLIRRSLLLAGEILQCSPRARQVVDFLEQTRADLARRARQGGTPPRAYVGGLGFRGAHGLGSSDSQYLPFVWLGIPNPARGSSGGSHVFLNKERLLALDPEVIFIDGGGLALIQADYVKRPRFYGGLRAFAQGRVHGLHPFNWYTTNLGTALADAYAIGKILLAPGFVDVDPAGKADEIYTFLVGRPVHGAMASRYGPLGARPAFLEETKP